MFFKPTEPTTEEKFNGASAAAAASTSVFTAVVGDLYSANADLKDVVDEASAEIDRVRDTADAEIERLTMLREAAAEKIDENVTVILNLRRIVGDIA